MNLQELREKQVVVINVGMSTANGIPSPLFKDGTFRFVPIRERKASERTPTYRDLGLSDWVPDPDDYAHNDPEFETMTFGDYEGKIRVANASKLGPGDFLFFFAALSTELDRRRRKSTGFFFIGYFEIDGIIPFEEAKSSRQTANNAHLKRRRDSGFSVWKGTNRSTMLRYAVPLNKSSANLCLRTSKGMKLPWGKTDVGGRQRSELQVVNSATRASRLILPQYREAFWKTVIERNPSVPILE